jgi:hypothetical protein
MILPLPLNLCIINVSAGSPFQGQGSVGEAEEAEGGRQARHDHLVPS